MNNKEIGKRIVETRTKLGRTQQEIADAVGVAKSTIQRYEAGKIKKIKLPVISEISRALNINPVWLIGKTDIKNPAADISDEISRKAIRFYMSFIENGVDPEALTDIDKKAVAAIFKTLPKKQD
jgi:transcriptional regulator with XRE-family HTH domain